MEQNGAFGLLEREGSLWMVANHRVLDGREVLCWDVPGGGVEPGESLVEACRREMLEETGWEIEVQDFAFLIERFGFGTRPSDHVLRLFFFHVKPVQLTDRALDPEIIDGGFKPLSGLRELCTQPYHQELHTWLESDRTRRYYLDRG